LGKTAIRRHLLKMIHYPTIKNNKTKAETVDRVQEPEASCQKPVAHGQ
jgi:predicted phosphohydrolase